MLLFNDSKSENSAVPLILCADATFGNNIMDGRLKVLSIKSAEDGDKIELSESHFVETTIGTSCARHFTFPEEDGKPA